MELLSKEGATVQREGPVAKEGRSDCPEGRAARIRRKEGTTVRRKQGSSDHSKEASKEGTAIIYRNSGGVAVVTRKAWIVYGMHRMNVSRSRDPLNGRTEKTYYQQ